MPSNALTCAVRAPHASKINLKHAAAHVDMNGPTILDAHTARQQRRAQQGSVFLNWTWVRRHDSTMALMCCTGSYGYFHCIHRLEFEFAQNRTPLRLRAQFASKVVGVVCACARILSTISDQGHGCGMCLRSNLNSLKIEHRFACERNSQLWSWVRCVPALEFEFAQNRTPLRLRAQFATVVMGAMCACARILIFSK